jgi:hypothetical protein
VIFDAVQHIKLDKLPSPEELLVLQNEGFCHLINVSGIDLFQLYQAEQLSPFTIKQHSFKDIFSKAPQVGREISTNLIDESAYITRSTAKDRLAFYAAVNDLIENLKTQTPMFVFCHQGIGRSPCVLFTALAQWYGEDYGQILKVIKFLNAKSMLTGVSYSATKWFMEKLRKQSIQ